MNNLFLIYALFIVGCAGGLTDSHTSNAISKPNNNFESLMTAIVSDVCENESLGSIRNFYGTAGEHSIVLYNSPSSIPWPAHFKPKIEGWNTILSDRSASDSIEEGDTLNRKLGLRLNSMTSVPQMDRTFLRVSVIFNNVGGYKNGEVGGGTSAIFEASYSDGGWKTKLISSTPN